MVIDFNEYVAQREIERKAIEANDLLENAQENLAEAYVEKGLTEIFEKRGMELSEDAKAVFKPLMLEAIKEGLTAALIEQMILDSINEVDGSEDG